MILLGAPTVEQLTAFVARQTDLPITYDTPGMTANAPPPGYQADYHRVLLGYGSQVFESARSAMHDWCMFPNSWITTFPAQLPIEIGKVVAITAHFGPIRWTNACRILQVTDHASEFSFAYGTLPDHAERGEERFRLRLQADGAVCYDILAYSQPQHWLAHLGYPLARLAQKKFARDSLQNMARCTQSALKIHHEYCPTGP